MGPTRPRAVAAHRRARPRARRRRLRRLRGPGGGSAGRRLHVRGRRRGDARPVQPLAAGRAPRAVAAARSWRVRMDRRRLEAARPGRPRAVRAACRHVHARGHVRGGDPAPARAARARHHRDRADAGGRVPGPPRVGLRRRLRVGRAVLLRWPAGAPAARRRRPRRRPGRDPRRRLQPRRRLRHQGTDRLRAVLHRAVRHPVGRRDQLRRAGLRRRPGMGDPERRAVGARLPRRRAAARRRSMRSRTRAPSTSWRRSRAGCRAW